MRIYLFVLMTAFFVMQSSAQNYEWTKTFGGSSLEQIVSITSDQSGNTYSTGYFFGTVDFDPGPNVFNLSSTGNQVDLNVFVQKLDPQGNFVWAITLPGVNFDDGRSITIDSSGNLIIVGRSEISGMSDNIMIFKLDPQGNVIFLKIYGNNVQDFAKSVVTDALDNIYMIGQFQNTIDLDPGTDIFDLTANGNTDIFIQKLNSNGDFIWAKSIGGNGLDLGRQINIDPIGNLYISGFFSETCDFDPGVGISNMTSNGSWDAFIVKLNNNGELIWHRGFGSYDIDDATSIDIDGNGNVIILGNFIDTVDFNPNGGVFNLTSNGEDDIFLLKLDMSGEFLWAKSLGSIYSDTGQSVTVDNANEIYITGGLFNPENFDPDFITTDYDIFINKYTSDGNLLWDLKIGGPDADVGNSIHVDGFYNIYVGGYFYDTVDFNPDIDNTDNFVSNGVADVFITKYSQDIELPIAYPLALLVGCDDNNDGFSDNFDTSDVESTVLNSQTGLLVTYYDENGNELPSPLPNPFTNTNPYTQNITVRVTNPNSLIYDETIFELQTVSNPDIDQPSDIFSCDEGDGFSSFDTSAIQYAIIGSRTGLEVFYFDENENALPSPLPNPLQNTIVNQETIFARVYYQGNDNCYSEVNFNLIVGSVPDIYGIDDIYECDTNNDGFTEFNLSDLESALIGNQSDLTLEYFSSDDSLISTNELSSYNNITPDEDFITVRASNDLNECYEEITIILRIDPLPIAYSLNSLKGCDDNNDGFSEYFDTSNIESQVLNEQTGMAVSYYTDNGVELSNPLPNPYTNIEANSQNIIVRVTNSNSNCYSETILELETVTQPTINQPANLYACDLSQGYSEFDTSLIEEQIIGNQTGLIVSYYDSDNNELSSPLPSLFQNTSPNFQTIYVRVEDAINSICYSETSFDLVVNSLLEIDLDKEYVICNSIPSINLSVGSGFYSYEWYFENETLISTNYTADIEEEGNYTLTIAQLENNILCETSFDFYLIRSIFPEIQQVNHGDLATTYIEIITREEGNFEYSLDGFIFQDSNYFSDVEGGTYTVFARDKEGCGEDSTEVTIVGYPKFFTPNNDGFNDYWQIRGITKFPNSKILIFNRYGKVLKELSENDLGWDGLYNGEKMYSDDYWFKVTLRNGTVFSGHFALKR